MTTLSASFSTTSWPGRSESSSTAGLTLTRILRPPVKTSAVPSSQAPRNTPKPEGGLASRSTSSFSATIWSRASRSVSASRSFCPVTEASLASASRSRSSTSRACLGESASLRRRTATSSSRNEICVVRPLTWSSCRAESEPSSRVATPPPPSKCRSHLDPTYPQRARNLGAHAGLVIPPSPGLFPFPRALSRPAAAGRGGHAVGEPPRRHQEAGVADHPVPGPDREPVHVPAADERLPGGRLVEAALFPDRLHGPRQLCHGGDIAADHAASGQRARGGADVLPGGHHVQHHAVERLVDLGILMLNGWAGVTLARPARAAGGSGLRGGGRCDAGQIADAQPPGRVRAAEEPLDVLPGDVREVGPALVGDDQPRVTGRPEQPARQGARARPGLQHPRPRSEE